jgi:hypothetical protein
MTKTAYKMLGFIPIIGTLVQTKFNFFAMKCSPFMDDFTRTDGYKAICDWLRTHPDQVISPKKAQELIDKVRAK